MVRFREISRTGFSYISFLPWPGTHGTHINTGIQGCGVCFVRVGNSRDLTSPGSQTDMAYSPAVFGKTLQLRTYKVSLQFLYLEGVYFMNQVNALLAPLANSHNMQMKSAITKKSDFIELLIEGMV